MKKMRSTRMIPALAATMALGLAACSSDENAAVDTTVAPTTAPASTQTLTPTGTACGQVPTTGEGSVQGMADDPVGTAASNNPLLTTLVTAVTKANLVDTLNGPGPFTVFAPVNSAFEKIPSADLNALLADQQGLTGALTYHVVPGRMPAADLSDGKALTTVNGATLTVDKTGDTVKVGNATVICANVPVANGVVHLIDTVLMPPTS